METRLPTLGKKIKLAPNHPAVRRQPVTFQPRPPRPHANPGLCRVWGLRPRGSVLRLQSYWVVRINLDTFKKSKRQIAPLIPKCLFPSAATCSRWDLHNE